MPAWLASIEAKIIGGLLVVALIGGVFLWIYDKGESAGSADVKAKVATETVKTIDAARITKEKADAETHSVPYGERADGLR